jgi:transporter family protein
VCSSRTPANRSSSCFYPVLASWICYFRALDLGQASQVAPLDKMSVVFVAIFGGLFLGEQLSLLGWLGVAMIAGGAALMAFRS